MFEFYRDARTWTLVVVLWSLLQGCVIVQHARSLGERVLRVPADPSRRRHLLAIRGVAPVLCAASWTFAAYRAAVPPEGAMFPSHHVSGCALAGGAALLAVALGHDLRRTWVAEHARVPP